MVELHHKSHRHPLLFNEDTSSPSNVTYHCGGCYRNLQGPSYSCRECRFFLHKKCAEVPSEIHHPAHRNHPLLLLLLPASEVDCSMCHFKVKGFSYHCSSCEFYLDFNCAQLPHYTSAGNLIETLHVAHSHPLVSVDPNSGYWCNGCIQPIMDDASYACFDCREFFHKKCLELPSINHPCHRSHQLLPVFSASHEDFPKCNLCERYMGLGFFYRCVPCKFHLHLGCAWPPPIIEDKSHHDHPFTLLLKPNDPFHCNACGNKGNYVSYVCSTCNIQVHRACISLPRHIRLNLHPHPISHSFSPYIDQHDSRDWDCKICFENVNIEHGSYYCSRPSCNFVIHVKCSIENNDLYDVVEVENPDEPEESDPLYEPMSCIIRIIKEIKVGDDVIAAEIIHVGHEHNLILSDEIKDNKLCNGCVLPLLSSFYYCSRCDFFLHKACAELPRKFRPWFSSKTFGLLIDGIFRCSKCDHVCSGFFYQGNYDDVDDYICLRCALIPHSFTYQADKPHFLFFDNKYRGKCNACCKTINFKLTRGDAYRCKAGAFALDGTCVTIPRKAWHKCDQHSLTLAYQDHDYYPLRHYCDICEEERHPQQWFYHCETCDKAMHVKCVVGKYSFINAGSKYTCYDHPHPLTFVRKIYYYPECNVCGVPCQNLALECVGYGCKYIVHWTCIAPYYMLH